MLTLYEDEKKRSVNNPKLEIMYKDIKATVVDAKKDDTWDVFASDGKIYTISGCPSIVDAIKQSLVVEVARVMPPPEQVNQLFKMVMDILAIPDKQRGYMMEKTTVENQWKMIQLHNVSLVDDNKVEEAAKKWADMLRKGRVLSLSEASELERDVRTANKLWLMSFFNHDGLGGLFEQLAKLALRSSRTEEENKIAKHVVESVKATMNVSFGVERLLDTPNSVENLVNVLDVDLLANREFSEIVLELLSVLCFFEREDKDGADPDQGHKDVIAGFRQFAVQRGEIAPFHSLVSAMQRCKYHIDFPLVVIRLINEMINRTDRIEDRIPLRQEFERVSLLKVLLECRTHYDKNEGSAEPSKVEAFKTQIQVLESIMVADNEDRFSSATDIFDAQKVFDTLIKGAQEVGNVQRVLNVLHHLNFIPNDLAFGPQAWDAVQKAVHTITTLPSSAKIKEWRFDGEVLEELSKEFRRIAGSLTSGSDSQKTIDALKKKCEQLEDGA
jgi:hypothetical protein